MPSKTFLVNTSLLVQGTYALMGCADVSSSTEPRLMQRRGNLRVACVAHDLAGANVDGAFLASERGWDGGNDGRDVGRERPIAAGFSCCAETLQERARQREGEQDRDGERETKKNIRGPFAAEGQTLGRFDACGAAFGARRLGQGRVPVPTGDGGVPGWRHCGSVRLRYPAEGLRV